MGKESKIQWTHHTFNPWWGCARVSPGCVNCYAEATARRYGHDIWGPAPRRFFSDRHWNEPVRWDRAAQASGERQRVFCASMADVLEDRRDLDDARARVFKLAEATAGLDWLFLTKRPENFERLAPPAWHAGCPQNVWWGTTAEDQPRVDERLPHLKRIKAVVRFVSFEPLLSRVDARRHLMDHSPTAAAGYEWRRLGDDRIHWGIIGGESGAHARPFAVQWALELMGQLDEAGAAVFVKQLGAQAHSDDGVMRWPLSLRDRKGGDPGEWPSPLRVREVPVVGVAIAHVPGR